jgi:hypothetical protein
MCLANQLEKNSGEFLVWYLVDKEFKRISDLRGMSVDWERANWKEALSYASGSRTVLFKFCQEALASNSPLEPGLVSKFESIVRTGLSSLQLLQRTLITIKDLWDGKVDYYVIKTRDDRPTGDADVLFTATEKYESAIDVAVKRGYKFVREEPFKGWIPVKDGVKIELHNGLSWFGMKALDDDFVSSNRKETRIMNIEFQTITGESELGLELAHWIIDIQPLGPAGFINLVSVVEANQNWERILSQARKYRWLKQLVYHLSILDMLCRHVYLCKLKIPIELSKVKLKPAFPFWTPLRIKIPFLMDKVLRDNEGTGEKMKMLQLSLRRYAWGRLN